LFAGVKKDFSGHLHKFMASLTETANQSRGQTVLYLPGSHIVFRILLVSPLFLIALSVQMKT
jgi:hypothetical protein